MRGKMPSFTASIKQSLQSMFWTMTVLFIVSKNNAKAAFGNADTYRQRTTCVPIPSDLKLCQDVGYSKMILPNLLEHESLDEVRQQASSFVPLIRQGCHPHLKEFLCSLFAPVCLKSVPGPIPPCKSLCKSVERSCTPILRRHNFEWPPMLNCSKYTEREPCVNIVNSDDPITTTPPQPRDTNICAPCGTELQPDTLHDNFCASEFVLKIKAKKIKAKKSKGIREVVADRKRRVVYKAGPLSKRDLKRMKLVVRGAKRCECPALDNKQGGSSKKKRKGKKSFYLAMGRKVGRKLLVTVIHSWPKRNKVLRKASKTKFGAKQCPEFGIDMS